MAAAGAEAAAVAAEEEKRLPEDDPESGGDSEDEGDSDSSGDGEDEEKENEAEIQRLEEQVGPGGGVGRGLWGSSSAPAQPRPRGQGERRWRLGSAGLCAGGRVRLAVRDAAGAGSRGSGTGAAPGLWGGLGRGNRRTEGSCRDISGIGAPWPPCRLSLCGFPLESRRQCRRAAVAAGVVHSVGIR